jgi:tetratricopeptide (TPR) repeat protein
MMQRKADSQTALRASGASIRVGSGMFPETCRRFGRALVAGACAASLALPATVHAAEPEGPAPSTAETSEVLNEQAQKHANKALDHFNKGNYVDAEEEFRRVAFYAPNWRPMHYNLAVLAEAQGKLATAVSEYQTFRPHGSPEEQLVVDQRIDELGRRRVRIASAYKRQMGVGAGTLALGLGGLGGGVAMLVIHVQRKEAYEEAVAVDPETDVKKPSGGLIAGGYWVGLFGFIMTGVGVGLLVQAVKSKRKLDSIAVGKARLQWTGGAGVRLRF